MTQIGGDYNVWDETGRLEVWMNGMRFMLSDPLTGVGVSCFGEAIGQDRAKRGLQEMWQAPHNSLVQIGAETGIIGLVIFVLININVFKICGRVRNISGKQELAIIGTIIQIGFVGHFTASMFLSQAYSGIWVLFVALSATILEMGRTRNNQQHSKNIETEKRYL
jgi:O-antigen ligase